MLCQNSSSRLVSAAWVGFVARLPEPVTAIDDEESAEPNDAVAVYDVVGVDGVEAVDDWEELATSVGFWNPFGQIVEASKTTPFSFATLRFAPLRSAPSR